MNTREIWLVIRDGYYTSVAAKLINCLPEKFVTENIMSRQFAGIMNEKESMEQYEKNIASMYRSGILLQTMTPEDLPESDAGYIYLCGSFNEFKACSNEDTILLQLITPVKQHLDIAISPRQFYYGLQDTYDVDPSSPMMWQIASPSPIAPSDIILEEYVDKNAVKWGAYT